MNDSRVIVLVFRAVSAVQGKLQFANSKGVLFA